MIEIRIPSPSQTVRKALSNRQSKNSLLRPTEDLTLPGAIDVSGEVEDSAGVGSIFKGTCPKTRAIRTGKRSSTLK